jgi:hypothetical protein
MKPVMIIENSTNSLIKENNGSKKDYVLNGTFTEFGVVNRNERIYTAEKFLPALNELNQRISELGIVYGEFDHPDVFDTSLSRSSHKITKAVYNESKNIVEGEIKLLSTYWGKEAKALVDDDCPIFVSSRAAGVTESDGSVSLKKLFTYDIVADPGFASAKMSIKSINESLGFKSNEKTNFRIYEMSDESKINELFNMNQNDFVTKEQMVDYSKYLGEQLAITKKQVTSAVTKGNLDPKKLEQLMGYYEELNASNTKIVEYLDYLSEKFQVVVKENVELKKTTSDLIKHNDYLAENLEKNITYSEYIAEQLDKNISYSEYIAESLDKNIAYSEYIAENLDKNIAYGEYIAEQLDKNISYSEYIAENLESSIAYGEYIAESLDENIAYGEYIAENLDKSIELHAIISESIRTSGLNESVSIPSLEEVGFKLIETKVDTQVEESVSIEIETGNDKVEIEITDDASTGTPEVIGMETPEEIDVESIPSIDAMETPFIESTETTEETQVIESADSEEEEEEECEKCETCDCEECECDETDESKTIETDSDLSESINKLISEAKKRKVSENSDLNFLKFLNKSQVDSYYSLSDEDQDSVKLHINESSYFSSRDVLSLISEALSNKSESVEEKIMRLMPDGIKLKWEQLNESSKKTILSQARLYPAEMLVTESQIDNFWATRKIETKSTTKKLVSHQALIQEDKLSDTEIQSIMEKFKSIN